MKVGILTLGCKVNAYESEFVISKLKDAGYEIKDFNDVCDIYIINSFYNYCKHRYKIRK